jgi:nicotinate-nucleotide--dimethylbenzimidazole phosphoribosyltransferase
MSLEKRLQHLIDNKTKPAGSLGLLEDVALQIGLIQQTEQPVIRFPHLVVFAGDHGIAATGLVNPYPQAVTAQMVLNFLNGGAAINVFCRQNRVALKIADAGVAFDFNSSHPHFIDAKIAKGTNNYLLGPAMSETQCQEAIEKGKSIVKQVASTGCNCIGFGEMGIGNSSAASLIMSALLQLPVANCVGRGTGVSDEQLRIKLNTLQQVAQLHRLHQLVNDPIQLLCRIGGFEIAMMTGAYLEASAQRMTILVDGFIATAALLAAHSIEPSILPCCLFSHCSEEQGHQKMLEHLAVQPLLQLGLRLGEGTGAALALPLVQAAVNFLNEMASFESAGISSN